MDHDAIAELLRATPSGLPPGRPDLDVVERRRRRRRLVIGALVTLLVVAATSVPLFVLSSLAGNRGEQPRPAGSSPPAGSSTLPALESPTPAVSHLADGQTVETAGFSIDVPAGWHSSVWPGTEVPVAIVASVPLPRPGHFPSGDDRAQIDPDGILLMVEDETKVDPCAEYPQPSLPVTVEPSDYRTPDGIELAPGHTWANKAFMTEERCFYLTVEFGSNPPTEASLRTAADIMATLDVRPFTPEAATDPSPPPGSADGSVGWIVCTDHGTEVRTPRVVAQQDGFHFHVDNLAKADFIFFTGPDHGGFDLGTSPNDVVVPGSPGPTAVACAGVLAGHPLTVADIPAEDYASIALEDPSGFWHDADLSCDPTAEFGAFLRGQYSTVDELIAGLPSAIEGLRPNDTITYAGFSGKQLTRVVVQRDGHNVAIIEAPGALTHRDAFLSVKQCADAGLSPAGRG